MSHVCKRHVTRMHESCHSYDVSVTVSVSVCLYLSLSVSVSFSLCLSLSLSVSLGPSLSLSLSLHLSLSLSRFLSPALAISLSRSRSLSRSLSLSLSLSLSPSLFLSLSPFISSVPAVAPGLLVRMTKKTQLHDMGWLRLVGSLKSQVSFAEYRLFHRALLQKRHIVFRGLLTVATPYREPGRMRRGAACE